MSLSDKQPSRRPTRRAVSASHSHWSDSQKLEAVKSYLIFGSVYQTARMLSIPEQTIRNWRATEWWKEIENDLRVQDDLQLSARLKNVIAKGLDVVEDRMEKGDYVFDQKTGQLIRKPVNMRDAHKVVEDSVKRRTLLDNAPTGLVNKEATADKLLKLAEKFAELAGHAKQDELPILEADADGTYEEIGAPDAIHDEREA